jgi:hypothetical protein
MKSSLSMAWLMTLVITLVFCSSLSHGLYQSGKRFAHASVEHPAAGRTTALKYDVELSKPVLVLEKYSHLFARGECFDADHGLLRLIHASGVTANELLSVLAEGHVIVGSHKWACRHQRNHLGRSVQHLITKIVERSPASTTIRIEPVSYTQIYKHARISYKTNHLGSRSLRDFLSCSKKRSDVSTVNHRDRQHDNLIPLRKLLDLNCSETSRARAHFTHGKRSQGFFSFLSDVWNDIVGLADDVSDIIQVVVVAVKAIFTGDLDCDWPVADSTLNMNCADGSCNSALEKKTMGKYGVCDNCFAQADLAVNIDVVIQDYTLVSFVAIMEGKMLANVSSTFSFSEEEFWSAQCTLGIFQTGMIPIATVVPLYLQITVPVQIGTNASVRVAGTLQGQSWAAGDVRFGFNYSNGVMDQFKSTAFQHGGNSLPVWGIEADVTLWIVPAVVVTIDGMMEVSFSPKVFYEVSLGGEEAQNICPSGKSYSISSTSGTSGALSVKLDVEVMGKSIFHNSWGPFALWNLKHPLPGLTGCLFGSQSTRLGKSISAPPTVDTSYFLPGATWSGFFEATGQTPEEPCNQQYGPSPGLAHAPVSIQFIGMDPDSGDKMFVISLTTTASYKGDGSQNVAPGSCILQQRLYAETHGSLGVFYPTPGNDFNQCTGIAFTCVPQYCPPWFFSLSADNSVIQVWDSTNCNMATMKRF